MTFTADELIEGRTERVDIRMTPAVRASIKRAAKLIGTSVSNYMTMASLSAARRDIAEHTMIHVSPKAFESFEQALDNPDYTALDSVLSRHTIWDN